MSNPVRVSVSYAVTYLDDYDHKPRGGTGRVDALLHRYFETGAVVELCRDVRDTLSSENKEIPPGLLDSHDAGSLVFVPYRFITVLKPLP